MSDVVDKIRKLLARSKDKSGASTEAEQAYALEMAHRLMLQHNIKDVEEKREVHAVKGEWMHVDKDKDWESFIACAVAKLYNCRSLIIRGTGSHQFVGKPENIEICGDTFLWVCSQIEVFYKEALRVYSGSLGKRGRAELRRTFKEACAARVCRRVDEIVAKMRNEIPQHMALVVIDQSLAAANELIKDVKKGKAKTIRPGLGSHAGRLAGDRVQIQGNIPGSDRPKALIGR